MNYNDPIKFQQERDFGQVFNAIFSFIKQDFRKLSSIFIRYCGPLIILTVIASTLYQYRFLGVELNPYSSNPLDIFEGMWGIIVLMVILSAATQTMIAATIYSYISLYATKGPEGFEAEDVWKKVTENFFKLLGTTIVCGIIIGIGTVFCIIPGIYLGVSLCFILFIIVHEEKSFGDAFSRSFELSHERWWWTLLLIIVIFMIIGVISFVFTLPATIMTATSEFHNTNPGNFSENSKIILSVFNVLSSLISHVLNVVPLVAFSFQYFAIVESKDKTSLMNQIDQIN